MSIRQFLTSALVILGTTALLMIVIEHRIDPQRLLMLSAIAFVGSVVSGMLVGKGARS